MTKRKRITNQIKKSWLILCEGRDAYEFLIYYLQSDALKDNPRFSDDIQVLPFDGNEALPQYLKTIKKMDGFEKVKFILIIRDAERDGESAIREIKHALKKACYPIPSEIASWQCGELLPEVDDQWEEREIYVGYLLFPDFNRYHIAGTLEDLCLSILSENNTEILHKIDQFLLELKEEEYRTLPHEFKTKLHTYFSITDKFISMKIGEAAKAGAFNWEHKNLQVLRQFIEDTWAL